MYIGQNLDSQVAHSLSPPVQPYVCTSRYTDFSYNLLSSDPLEGMMYVAE
jgi:hypothetical protein